MRKKIALEAGWPWVPESFSRSQLFADSTDSGNPYKFYAMDNFPGWGTSGGGGTQVGIPVSNFIQALYNSSIPLVRGESSNKTQCWNIDDGDIGVCGVALLALF